MEPFEILINEELKAYGLITYSISFDGERYAKDGMLKTHLYIEEIDTLECDRFKLNGVNVYAESSGSNDIFYIYAFTYEELVILDNGTKYDDDELLEMYKREDQ